MLKEPKSSWPLNPAEIKKIHTTALEILENVGMADPNPIVSDPAIKQGCWLDDHGRLCFPGALVEDIIAHATPRRVLPARDEKKNVQLDDGLTHIGHAGIAPMVVDFKTGRYRDATLLDLYDLNRLIDVLPNVHTGEVMIIPSDVTEPVEHAVNKLYAVMAATSKHVIIDFDNQDQIDPTLALLKNIIGDNLHLPEASPVTFGFCPTRSPLSYEKEALSMSLEIAQRGYPISSIVAPLAGATAPTPLAGALAMTVAEALGALTAIQLVVPGHPMLLGIWPFVSDLRTGSFSGGGPEVALLNAAAAQIIEWYGIEGSVAAGMTDAKSIDAQSGYEKGLTVALSAVAGSPFIGEGAGMQGSLMGASFEAFVIDDELIANVNRIKRGIQVDDATLSYEVVAEVMRGPGNFLDHPQTLQCMRSEYVYPQVADRSMVAQWDEEGCRDILQLARKRVRDLLATHYPSYIEPALDARIREQFPIRLPSEAMRSDCGRW
jgi:trimethylamine--corrinoid protein Co-methyltransferase